MTQPSRGRSHGRAAAGLADTSARTARAGMTPQASARRLPRRPDACPPVPSSRPRSHAPSRAAPARFPTEPPQRRLGRRRRQRALRELRPSGRTLRGGEGAPRAGADRRRRGRRYLVRRRRNRRGCGTGRRRGRLDSAPAEPGSRGRKSNGSRYPCGSLDRAERRDRRTGRSARRRRSGRLGRPPGPRPPCAAQHRERAEMEERHGEPLRGQQRERLAAGRRRFRRTSPWPRPAPARACPSASRS